MTTSDDVKFKPSPRPVKVVLTLLVRDEEDIVDMNIAYHLSQGVDFVIATDNGSQDGTQEILEHYRSQGVLHVIDEEVQDYSQWRWVTRMARLALTKYGADWVINNDADEFWWPERGTLKETLEAIPDEFGIVVAPRSNALPPTSGTAASIEHMRMRWVDSLNPLGQPLPPKVCHRGHPSITVAQGNHSVEGVDFETYPGEPVMVFHFPFRSYKQFEQKVANGGAAYARNDELPAYTGAAKRMLYDLMREGKLPAWYANQVLDDAETAEALRDGRVILDDRLATYLSELRAGAARTQSASRASQGVTPTSASNPSTILSESKYSSARDLAAREWCS
jgi:hypothetical protein